MLWRRGQSEGGNLVGPREAQSCWRILVSAEQPDTSSSGMDESSVTTLYFSRACS